MHVIGIDRLLDKVGSLYKLVNLTAMRAVELSDGAANLTGDKPTEKTINVAIREIFEGKVTYKETDGKK